MKKVCEHCGSTYEVGEQQPTVHQHTFGEGYYTLEDGSRVSHTQVCKTCGFVQTLPYEAKPVATGIKLKGVSGGGRQL